MKILAYKPGHDGHVTVIDDGRLVYSIEAEKDSGARYGAVTPDLMLHGMSLADGMPDVIAESGWLRSFRPMADPIGAGYFGAGTEGIIDRPQRFLGSDIRYFSSSHERSHLLGSYAMSPFPQGQPCYALVWEGVLGHFYRIDENLNIEPLGSPLDGPGHKYGFLYGLADPAYPVDARKSRREDAGKLMAIAGLGSETPETPDERATMDSILNWDTLQAPLRKSEFTKSAFFNIGLDSPEFHNLARRFQREIFARFHDYASDRLTDGLPILVSGGCGLNCDWNSDWRESGLFADVFVQPCANDSGSAIGTAVDAQWFHTGNAKLEWTVYAGEAFVTDQADLAGFEPQQLDLDALVSRLADGEVYAWVQGAYEIGPRALGNRSLIAAPFTKQTHTRLNAIKKREGFRPFAPSVLAECADQWFEEVTPSPYMSLTVQVRPDKREQLGAVVHVDGSARIQTLDAPAHPLYHAVVSAFAELTGVPMVLNTSFNVKGEPIVETASDAFRHFLDSELDDLIVEGTHYRKRPFPSEESWSDAQPRAIESFTAEVVSGADGEAHSVAFLAYGDNFEATQLELGLLEACTGELSLLELLDDFAAEFEVDPSESLAALHRLYSLRLIHFG